MKKAALLLTAMLVFALAVPVMAQRMFEDVPTDHWAYQAVSSLQERGVVIGYPDGTFSGKRAMTRYEFAVATARLLDWVNSQLDSRIQEAISRVRPGIDEARVREIASEEAGKVRDEAVRAAREAAEEAVRDAAARMATKEDLENVRRLVEEFRDELATLGADVQRIRDDINRLKERVSAIEEKLAKIKVSGEGTLIWRGAHARMVGPADNRKRNPIFDLDSRADLTRGRTPSNILDDSKVLYQLAVGVDAKMAENITGSALLVSGNYLPWAASNRLDPNGGTGVQGNFGKDFTNLNNAELTPLKLYVQGAVGDWWFLKGLEVTVGKFGMQLGPYTLKQVDPDSYTTTMVTDSGDVIMSGIAAKANVGKIELMMYAAKHDRGGFDSGYALFQSWGGPAVLGPANYKYDAFPIDQSAAIRGKIGLGSVTLGVTYLEGGISALSVGGIDKFAANLRADKVQRAQVISADLNVPFSENLSLAANFSRSDLLQSDQPGMNRTATIGNRETAFAPGSDKNAWDAKLNLGLGRLTLAAGYKRIDPFFGAPGYWGAIGRWKNPTNIQGWNGELSYAFSDSVCLTGMTAVYDSPTDPKPGLENLIQHYRAGLRWNLSESNQIELGWEQARVRPAGAGKTRESYYTIGFGHKISENASWKVAYQLIDYKDGGAKLYGNDYRGGIGVTQVSVRF